MTNKVIVGQIRWILSFRIIVYHENENVTILLLVRRYSYTNISQKRQDDDSNGPK